MKLIIDIPEDRYKDVIELQQHHLLDSYAQAVANGIPYETVTEFADRCKECGAKYGKLLKAKSIPYLMHKEMDIPLLECQKAYDIAIEYLRNQAKIRG